MAEPFLGEIRMMACDFAPRGWALCNGQLLPMGQNTALYSLFGTVYGGDGKVTFGLPNLQGRGPVDQGQGPGLTERFRGEVGGATTVTLTKEQMPKHDHRPMCDDQGVGNTGPRENTTWSGVLRGLPAAYQSSPADVPMGNLAIQPAGGGQPHNNMSPYLPITFIVALEGIFPIRG